METKNVLIGAGVAGAAAGAYYLYKKSKQAAPVVDIPAGTYADEYVPPAVTQDYQDVAPKAAEIEKQKQLELLKSRMQAFIQQQQQKIAAASEAEKNALREEYKAKFTDLQNKLIELQREREAEGKDTPIDREEDVKEIIEEEKPKQDPSLPPFRNDMIVKTIAALNAIPEGPQRVSAAKLAGSVFMKYPYPQRQEAIKYAQAWFAGLSFEQKKQVYAILESIGLGPVMLAIWKKAQEAKQAKEQQAASAAKNLPTYEEGYNQKAADLAKNAIVMTSAPKDLPENALVMAVARLEKITDLAQRRVAARQFATSLSEYTEASKQRAMRYANTWFRAQPFDVKKRVWDVMVSIGMGENLKVAWEAAVAQQEAAKKAAEDAAKATLAARTATDTAARQIQTSITQQKAQEEQSRIAAEQAEQQKTQAQVALETSKVVNQQLSTQPAPEMTAAQKKTLEMRVLQTLMNLTIKFPTLTPREQSTIVRTLPMQWAQLPTDSQQNVKKLYVAWFMRQPKEFQDKVRGMIQAAQ